MDVCLQIKQKKFEVLDRRMMFNGLMALMSVTGAVPTGRPPDPHLQGDQVTSRAAIFSCQLSQLGITVLQGHLNTGSRNEIGTLV